MPNRIIAKIDNDFNPSDSDWIPRVGAWIVDAMGMMNVVTYETKRERVPINNRTGRLCFPILGKVNVYDENGCIMQELGSQSSCGCSPSIPTGNQISANDYVIVNDKTIEVGRDTEFVTVEYKSMKTNRSETYGCDLPVIPNNSVVIEAITNYCMYKMLTRGYRHPVMNLAASQYGTNPYYIWLTLSKRARVEYINELSDKNVEKPSNLLSSSFMLSTFG